jgi:Fe-S cluster assembly protein SufB
MRDENQLHAAVVELSRMEDAEIKYSTVQNGIRAMPRQGRHLQFRHQARICAGDRSKISWTQVETGSAITWKYPVLHPEGRGSVGEFYSVALTNIRQQADTGTKMIHIGKNSRSNIVSKGISAGRSNNTYRGLVKVHAGAENVRNFTQCDQLLLGDQCGAHTVPYIEVQEPLGADRARGHHLQDQRRPDVLRPSSAVSMRGCGGPDRQRASPKEVLQQLPMEFAVGSAEAARYQPGGQRRMRRLAKLLSPGERA